MRKLLLFLTFVLGVAVAASASWRDMPLEEKLLLIEAAELMPDFAPVLAAEPAAVQAVLVTYVDDPVLLLQAQAALLQQPALARRILPLYGAEPEFKAIFRQYGASVLPPIAYFLDNRIRTLELQRYAARKLQDLRGKPAPEPPPRTLTPEERGWHAVNYILASGHGFLGQFVLDADGSVRWLQTERVVEGVADFFTGGIRDLERKVRTSQDVTAADAGWAALDAFFTVGAVKLLRAGKAARTTRLGRASRFVANAGALVAPVAAGYVVIRHPGLINDFLAQAAKAMGWPVRLTQVAGWTVLLTLLLYPLSWLLIWLLPLAIGALRLCLRLLRWLNAGSRQLRARRAAAASGSALEA